MLHQRFIAVLSFLALLALTGCEVDRSDPEQVTRAFIKAVVAGDKAKALSFVAEDQREEFAEEWEEAGGNMVSSDMPPADELEMRVELDQDEALVTFTNFTGGGGLRRENGQWWITN